MSRGLLGSCFFLSGLTALIYQVVWGRYLALLFGSTTHAVATVLCAFMAGLGAGALFWGRLVDRKGHPVRTYALLEIAIGSWAVCTPIFVGVVELALGKVVGGIGATSATTTLYKFLFAIPIVTVPSFLMGGTLPVLATAMRQEGHIQRDVSLLYGLNTIGAAIGSLLAGFVLIELLGLQSTLAVGAAVNVSIGLYLLFLLRGYPDRGGSAQQAVPVPQPRAASIYLTLAVLFTGYTSMLFEVVWTRLLSITLGSSTYSFASVLVVFLAGMGIGGLISTRLKQDNPARTVAIAVCLLGISVYPLLPVFEALPRIVLGARMVPGASFPHILFLQITLASAIMFVPALLFGVSLPVALGAAARAASATGTPVGRLYLINTIGTVLGSLFTGFVVVPAFGTQDTLRGGLVATVVFGAVGVVLFLKNRRLVFLLIAASATCISLTAGSRDWRRALYDLGAGTDYSLPKSPSRLDLHKRLFPAPFKLVFLEEGLHATVTVRQYEGRSALLINGKPDATDGRDMPTQLGLAVIPALLHPNPHTAVVIGYGSGVTARGLADFPEVESVEVVEIERSVIRASVHFRHVNRDVLDRQKVHLVIDDARSHLAASRKKYDLIVSEPSNPWISGIANLFTRDFYRRAKSRLESGGLYAQWLQTYSLDGPAIELALRTFVSSFKHTQIWYTLGSDLLLIGSEQPIVADMGRIRAFGKRLPELARETGQWLVLRHPEEILSRFVLPGDQLRKALIDGPLHTDDHPLLQYLAPRGLYLRSASHLDVMLRAKERVGAWLPPRKSGRSADELAALIGTARSPDVPPRSRMSAADQALAISDHANARSARSAVLFATGRRTQAFADLEQIRQRKPQALSSEDALMWARLSVQQGHYDVEEVLRIADEERPCQASYLRAQAHMEAGDIEAAWQSARKAFMSYDRNVELRQIGAMNLGQILQLIMALGQRSEDAPRAYQLIADDRHDPISAYSRAILAARLKLYTQDAKGAWKALQVLDDYQSTDPSLLRLRARVLSALGNKDAAGDEVARLSWLLEPPRELPKLEAGGQPQ